MVEDEKKRYLVGADNVGIQSALYALGGSQIVTLFQDNQVAVWDSVRFVCLYRINLSISCVEAVDRKSIELGQVTVKGFLVMQKLCCFSRDGVYFVIIKYSECFGF